MSAVAPALPDVPALVGVALAALLATELCARLAPHLGWTDAPRGAEAARKRQGRAVPAVGGVALLLALAWAPGWPWHAHGAELWGPLLPGPGWLALTLGLLLALGSWDDRVGLAAGPKVLGQLVALAPLALGTGGGPGAALLLLVLGLIAVNVLNTFDNADGALGTLAALGFAPVAPFVCAALLGFLPLNLDAARARNRASAAPSAYLGDAGAFVLAFLLLVHPRAVGLLVVPLLDLARLSCLRLAAGSRPWRGDRRHLAHRLEARGLGRAGVALLQGALAAPAGLLVAHGLARGAWTPALAGIGLSALLFVLALRCAPERARP